MLSRECTNALIKGMKALGYAFSVPIGRMWRKAGHVGVTVTVTFPVTFLNQAARRFFATVQRQVMAPRPVVIVGLATQS